MDDRGTNSTVSCDYPDFARAVAEEVAAHGADLGILVCSTGIGMSIAANKVPGIRAAKVDTEFEAGRSREHNDANVLALGAETVQQKMSPSRSWTSGWPRRSPAGATSAGWRRLPPSSAKTKDRQRKHESVDLSSRAQRGMLSRHQSRFFGKAGSRAKSARSK